MKTKLIVLLGILFMLVFAGDCDDEPNSRQIYLGYEENADSTTISATDREGHGATSTYEEGNADDQARATKEVTEEIERKQDDERLER